MGIFLCKRPETDGTESEVSYEKLCDALSRWYGEPAFFAHVIHLDDLTTSFISHVVRWKVCAKRSTGYEYAELVLKSYPWKESRGRSFRTEEFFKNEIAFYDNVLPELLKFQDSKKLIAIFDNHVKLCFTHNVGKNFLICTGNVSVLGFETAKIKKMDVEHGKIALNALAKLHAISFALKDQDPNKFNKITNEITETLYSEHCWGWYKKLWGKICAIAIDAVEKEYPNTSYVDKIKKFAVLNRFKDLIKAVSDKQNGVITHGDCATSNYLFKYVNDRPVDVKLVDFQQVRCCSPVLDVSSLLYTNSLSKDYDALLKYYHGVLTSQIKELGSDPVMYKWDVFMNEVTKYSFFGLAVCFDAATTQRTAKDIDEKLVGGSVEWESNKIINIADILDVKNLEDQDRTDLANNVVHCVQNGYI